MLSCQQQRKFDIRMNSVGKTAQQTDDWQQNEDDVLRQLQRLGCCVSRDTVEAQRPNFMRSGIFRSKLTE